MKNIIPYGKQKIFISDFSEVNKALKSNFITNGEYVKKFEKSFSKYTKAKYSITCSSGTAAIDLALKSIGLKKNDNIIIPSVNFIAAANMAKLLGANIFLADVDRLSGQMRPSDLLNCIKFNRLKKIKAFFVMYNGGCPNFVKEFYNIKKKFKTIIIEDACHALGSKYSIKKNFKIGNCKFSDLATFSFHPLKTITTGEGGMVTTNNKILNDKLKIYRNHGMVRGKTTKYNYNWAYKIVDAGHNYRLSDLNCALGYSQLKKINQIIQKRKYIANLYNEELKELKPIVDFPKVSKDLESAWHLYVININFKKLKINRKILIQKLFKNRITTQVHYIPTFNQPLYKSFYQKNKFKNAKAYYENCLSLPIYYDLNSKTVKNIAKKLKNIIHQSKHI